MKEILIINNALVFRRYTKNLKLIIRGDNLLKICIEFIKGFL